MVTRVYHQIFTKSLALMPRIATVLITREKETGNTVIVLNTHINYNNEKVQMLQLDALTKIIKTCNTSVFTMTGDFNLNPDSELMKKYLDIWKALGVTINRVKEDTWISLKDNRHRIYDYIFTRGIDVTKVNVVDYRKELGNSSQRSFSRRNFTRF